ncbi:putative nuclear RNA binding protein [Aspergillus affinis]|uniref:putative nuclear RNA binding protein n=1 Tax=Aspergillus affinis TaxID=1070780 RepID=UPI0022FE4AB7|nr:uncharacterized protein KD926_010339 [Aspergillus affinis]KAI9045016.1 hypothetical protein KD926_010339 [Aspergillus affinis]
MLPDMDVDPSHQLQHSLQLMCSRDASPLTHSRKHSRGSSSGDYYDDDELDLSSEESGQFDDAEEELGATPLPTTTRSPSTHSAKRRRSNDWPFDQGEEMTTAATAASSTGHRWTFHGHSSKNPGSNNGSPRTTGRRAGNRGRRSRFVEGHMNDSVSEKPPSIFLRDANSKSARERRQPSHKPSGIFRFGKAIASAFNPFGVLHNVSDIWKGPSETQKPSDDTLARAEAAYAELKKAGYKGTVKGSYMQSAQGASSHNLPDQTWKSIQEKMDYKPAGRHLRQSSGEGIGSGGSIRSSFQELRKARSSLGIPAMSLIPGRRSDDADFPEMRRQKSRKELQRQAKLLKRVSDLEEKLERARRELQELMSEEDLPSQSLCAEKPYSRKFVPGMLPSLPSERILQHRAASLPASGVAASASPAKDAQLTYGDQEIAELPSTSEKPIINQTTPRPASASKAQSLAVDSPPSRKRKSPDPQSARAEKMSQTNNADASNSKKSPAANVSYYDTDLTPSRKPKLPKMVRQDSPGSVERKQTRDQEHQEDSNGGRSPGEDRGRRSVQPLRSHSKRSPSQRRRASNSRNRGTGVTANNTRTPSLRMKKGRANLRCDSNTITDEFILRHTDPEDKENQSQPQTQTQQPQLDATTATKVYHQENEEPLLDLDQITPSPSPSPTKRKDQSRYNQSYSYIPPVPPIPKDLAATAAKVDRRLAKEMGKKREARGKKYHGQGQENIISTDEAFRWPDDIF